MLEIKVLGIKEITSLVTFDKYRLQATFNKFNTEIDFKSNKKIKLTNNRLKTRYVKYIHLCSVLWTPISV